MLSFSITSCKNAFDVEPEHVLDSEQMYQNVYDADAAIIGIYSKLMGVTDRILVLNELRADLMNVTINANNHLREINNHQVSLGNPYADPRPFYDLINNCNDVLANFKKMRAENKLDDNQFVQRYSDVGALRSWLYLQLGIHYGNIPYVTVPVESIDDLKDQSQYGPIPFDQLLDSLVQFTEALPWKDPYPTTATLGGFVDGYNTAKLFVNKKCVLGDIHLWKGNYLQAAKYYKDVMTYADVLYPTKDSEQWYETYRIGSLTNQLRNERWGRIFSEPYGERDQNLENIWMLPYDKNFSPRNPFINLFASGLTTYLLKPSTLAISNWNNQVRADNTPGDWRAVGSEGRGASYRVNPNGDTVVYKFVSNYNSSLPFETTGKFIMYRASKLHLRFSEAANRNGRTKLAHALVNSGINYHFDDNPSGGNNRNVSNTQQTFDVPPYDFDARNGNFPVFRNTWYRNTGIRGRVNLTRRDAALETNMLGMEDAIIDEAALELAFEGNRWDDLLRISLRRGDMSFLANKVQEKFIKAGRVSEGAAVRARILANPYLPFKW